MEVQEDAARRRRLAILGLMWLKKQRRWAVRPILKKRKEQGDFYHLLVELRLNDHDQYHTYLRMMPNQFDALLRIVGPLIQKRSCREPICPAQRLAVTLRYLASGDSMTSLGFAYRLGQPTVSKIIADTCAAIWLALGHNVFLTPTKDNWNRIALDFWQLWNFPNCVGAIDGKHVIMQAPAGEGSANYNFKGSHSIVLLAACDARYCFTIVDIGAPGRHSDGGIFQKSNFGKLLEAKSLDLPPASPLPGVDAMLPYVFVGDEAFPLKDYLMRPFPGKRLPAADIIFNYRLSRCRRMIENTFGIMASMWRIFRKPIITTKTLTTKRITKAAVCLHNWLMKADYEQRPSRLYCPPNTVDHEDIDGQLIEGQWRRDVDDNGAMQPMQRVGSNNRGQNAVQIRAMFKNYFMGVGEVPWQWNKVAQ